MSDRIRTVRMPRIFYRGQNPGDKRRISTGEPAWDRHLFVSSDLDHARMYGRQITQYQAKPAARILYEGTPDWRRVVRPPQRRDESLLDYATRAASQAQEAGYHAAHFARQGDVGTAVFDPSMFVSSPYAETEAAC